MQATGASLSTVLPVTVRGRLVARRSIVAGGRRMVAGGVGAAVVIAEVDYSSNISVFPMEACDLVGGEACDAHMYPETKLGSSASASASAGTREEVEREYLAYDDPKTVFLSEACDDLGGDFCEAPYKTGVSKD